MLINIYIYVYTQILLIIAPTLFCSHKCLPFLKCYFITKGVLEVTRIRQEGFAWRPEFAEFVQRYKIIAFPVLELDSVPLTAESAQKIIKVSPE